MRSIDNCFFAKWLTKKLPGTVPVFPAVVLLFIVLIISLVYRESIMAWITGYLYAK